MERIDVDLATTAPHPALRRFVRYYSQRRIVPGDDLQEPVTARLGGLLEFHFASLYRIPIVGTDRFESCAPMLVVGPITYRRLHLTANGTVESLTVMFQPFGLYELFGVPTQLLTEHAVEAHSLLGRSISQLYDALGEARSFRSRVCLLDQFLLKRLSSRNGCATPTGRSRLPSLLRTAEHTPSANSPHRSTPAPASSNADLSNSQA